MSDRITADIGELNNFVDKARHIKDRMDESTHHIMDEFKNIYDWEDQIRERVGFILDDIQKNEFKIFEYLEEVYQNIREFSDELDDYLNTSKRF